MEKGKKDIKQKTAKPKRKIWRKLLLGLLIIFIILSAAVLMFLESENFRRPILAKIVGIVNNAINADVAIGDINFACEYGIEIKDVALYIDTDTIATAKHCIIDIDIKSLFNNKIAINNVILSDGGFNLRTDRNGITNVSKIAKTKDTEEDTTATKLIIDVGTLKLENCYFQLYDSTQARLKDSLFDPAHMKYSGINFNTSAYIDLSKMDMNFAIRKLTAYEHNSFLNVEDVSGKVRLSNDGLDVKKLHLQTDNSDFTLSTFIQAAIFAHDSTRTFLNSKYTTDLTAKNIALSDIKKFAVIPVDVLGENKLSAHIEGYLNDRLNIELEFENKSIKLNLSNAYVNSILDTAHFTYGGDLLLSAQQRDIAATLPFIDLTNLPQLHKFELRANDIRGSLDSAGTNLEFYSSNGNIKGNAGFKFKGTPSYIADINVQNINLDRLLKKKGLSNSLNAHIYAKGTSLEINKVNGTFEIEVLNSNFDRFQINQFTTRFTAKAGYYTIDTLIAEANAPDLYEPMHVDVTGIVDYRDHKKPIYDLFINTQSLNLAYVLQDKAMPELLTLTLDVKGESIEIDDILIDLGVSIKEMSFYDKSLMPFDINCSITEEDSIKIASLKSEFIDIDIAGHYSINEMQKHMIDFFSTANFQLKDYISLLQNNKNDSLIVEIPTIDFPEMDFILDIDVKDVGAFSTFWPKQTIELWAKSKIQFNSDSTGSKFKLDSLLIDRLIYEDANTSISAKNTSLLCNIVSSQTKHRIKLKELDFDFDAKSPIIVNKKPIVIDDITMYYEAEKLKIKIDATYDNLAQAIIDGEVDFGTNQIAFTGQTVSIKLGEDFLWKNTQPTEIQYARNGINIQYFDLLGPAKGRLELTGAIVDSTIKDVVFKFENFDIQTFKKYNPAMNIYPLTEIDSVHININAKANGALKNPDVDISIKTSPIYFEEQSAGYLDIAMQLRNKIVRGNMNILQKGTNAIKVIVERFPTEIFLSKEPLDNKIDLKCLIEKFDVAPYSRFVPEIEELKGTINSNISITGNYPDNLDYAGNFKIPALTFTARQTNVPYSCALDVELDNQEITLNSFNLSNTGFKNNGTLNVSGACKLDDKFAPYDIDMRINANELRLLSSQTQAVMPTLYGDLLISTENNLHFTGDLQHPKITGGIALVNSNLHMSLMQNKKKVESRLQYRVVDDGKEVKVSFFDEVHEEQAHQDSLQKKDSTVKKKLKAPENDFFKNLAMNIDFHIRGTSSLSLDLGAIGEMYAEVKEIDNKQIDFNKKRLEEIGQVYGKLTLSDKSTLRTFKMLNLSGFVDFPTHSPLEPEINVRAVYKGTLSDNGARKNYEVIIELTGPVENLQNKIYYTIQNTTPVGDQSEIQQNALMLLLTGQLQGSTQDDQETENANNLLQSGTSALLSTFASKSLNGVLQSNFISNAGIDFKGDSFDEATIQLTGQLPGNITWTFGGDITNINGAREITIELPIYTLIENKNLRNVFLQASWNENSQNTDMDDDETDWEIKLNFNKSW